MRFVTIKRGARKGARLDASELVHVGDRDKLAEVVADTLNLTIRRYASPEAQPEHPICIACILVAASDGASALVKRYHPDVSPDEVRRIFGSIVVPVGRQG